ncbi:uncharacterized protein OCT59_017000 [Rhizophagus irregularis]|uniref:uncharacterized protein n=1 Tax=Rhizophagus irregularis TaxID=588596 RepID=UPI00332F1E7A|nr:hypothetical protein OCT59_017000 [Rhizophagus irregularis]
MNHKVSQFLQNLFFKKPDFGNSLSLFGCENSMVLSDSFSDLLRYWILAFSQIFGYEILISFADSFWK